VCDLPVREAEHAVAPEREFGVACAVGFERGPSAVVLVAIDLDDQAAFGPEEVDEEGTEPHVYSRCRDAMAAAQAQELPLEYAARWCLVNHVADAVAARPGAVDDGLPLLARQDPLEVAESLDGVVTGMRPR
jgi:hypothetical protein